MAIDFKVRDIKHKIVTKFIHAFLPEARKPYNLKAVHQPEIDIHAIASKVDTYNIQTSPKVIEEGLTAGMELIYYLIADGFRIKTPLFNIKLRIPGEYDGSETHLSSGTFPLARLQTSSAFREYLKEHTDLIFDGIEAADGYIAQITDEATELIDDVATVGNLLTVRSFGLKIDGDEAHKDETGLFFEPVGGGTTVKADIVAVNEPRTIKVIVPALEVGKNYTPLIVTQSSAKGGGGVLKNTRSVQCDFTLTARI